MLRQIVVAKEPLVHLTEQEKNELNVIRTEYFKVVNQYVAVAAKIPDLNYSGYEWQKLHDKSVPTLLPDRWQVVAWKQAVLHVLSWRRRQQQQPAATEGLNVPPVQETVLPTNSDVVRLYRSDNKIADVYLQIVGLTRHRPIWQPVVFSEESRRAIAAYGGLSRIVNLQYDDATDTWFALSIFKVMQCLWIQKR